MNFHEPVWLNDVNAIPTEPLLDHYRRRGILLTVDGDRPADEVTASILAAIEAHAPGS